MAQHRSQRRSAPVEVSSNDLNTIVRGDALASAQTTNTVGQYLGRTLAENGLTTSQIRHIFSQVRRIEMKWPLDDTGEHYQEKAHTAQRDFILLKPKLAYQAQREKEKRKLALGDFAMVLNEAIDLVRPNNREDFQRFVDFFEATLAYHKAAGGKD